MVAAAVPADSPRFENCYRAFLLPGRQGRRRTADFVFRERGEYEGLLLEQMRHVGERVPEAGETFDVDGELAVFRFVVQNEFPFRIEAIVSALLSRLNAGLPASIS